MKKQTFLLGVVAALGGLAMVASGCLGSDPNMNSQTYTMIPGSTAGVGGGGGMNSTVLGDIVGVPLATYDTTTEGFSFSSYDEPTNLDVHYVDMPPTLTFDPDVGSPTAGSIKVYAPYSGANQYVDIQSKAFAATDLRNWAGGKLHVRLRIDTGSTFMGQVEPYVDTTTAYAFVGSSLNPRQTSDWQDFTVDLGTAMTQIAGFDLTKVILFGVHIGSGGAGATQKPVTFHIDSFSVEGIAAPPAPDAGAPTDGATAD